MTHHSFAKFAMSDCHIHGICHRISVVVVVLSDRRQAVRLLISRSGPPFCW
jgi:hypothetical protein